MKLQKRKWRRKRKKRIPILLGEKTLVTSILHFILTIIHILLLLHLKLMALTDLAKITLLVTTRTHKLITAITETIHTISLTSDTIELQLQSPKTIHTISLTPNTLELFSFIIMFHTLVQISTSLILLHLILIRKESESSPPCN